MRCRMEYNIFIAPQRIQRKRYQDLKNAAKKRQFQICDNLSPEVTHVVTEMESREQLLRCLKLGEAELSAGCELLSLGWFVESMKAGRPVDVADKHRLKGETRDQPEVARGADEQGPFVAEWACQRITCLQHHNHRFTEALETVERHAELRDSEQDYSRALAFRRASCVLKSLPFSVTSMAQLKDLKDLGAHSKKIIKDILEDGVSEEVEGIKQDDWFRQMKEFTSVFGAGPSTAKKWIERGWQDVSEACKHVDSSDWRVKWGLAFHRDLTTAVTRREADVILDLVTRELRQLLPGAIVTLTGGFRRGKPQGHDVDLLISHPEEGREQGVLTRLLGRLEAVGALLCGNLERSTYSPDALARDFKLSMRGQLDHFEKWLGMVKVDQRQLDVSRRSQAGPDSRPSSAETSGAEGSPAGSKRSLTESLDDGDNSTSAKRHKLSPEGLTPLQLAEAERDWLARRVDLIVTPYSQYYYALVGWTGSKHFNRDLRLYAAKKFDRKMTSHGLFDQARNESLPASSEKEVFDHLQLEYREPWQRNC